PCKALHHPRRRRDRCLVPTPSPEPGSGRLMEEPMLNRRYFTLSFAGLAVLAAFLAPGALAPAQADGIRTFNCVGGRGSVSRVSSWRRGVTDPPIIPVPGPRTGQEIAEAHQRDKPRDVRALP